jgi:hypothetical protein
VFVILQNMDVLCMTNTIKCKLVASFDDFGYIHYVFESEDSEQNKKLLKNSKYITVTRFPNWENAEFNLGDIGYLLYKEIIPGKDTWFDGEVHNFYKSFEGCQFLKFIKENISLKAPIILD